MTEDKTPLKERLQQKIAQGKAQGPKVPVVDLPAPAAPDRLPATQSEEPVTTVRGDEPETVVQPIHEQAGKQGKLPPPTPPPPKNSIKPPSPKRSIPPRERQVPVVPRPQGPPRAPALQRVNPPAETPQAPAQQETAKPPEAAQQEANARPSQPPQSAGLPQVAEDTLEAKFGRLWKRFDKLETLLVTLRTVVAGKMDDGELSGTAEAIKDGTDTPLVGDVITVRTMIFGKKGMEEIAGMAKRIDDGEDTSVVEDLPDFHERITAMEGDYPNFVKTHIARYLLHDDTIAEVKELYKTSPIIARRALRELKDPATARAVVMGIFAIDEKLTVAEIEQPQDDKAKAAAAAVEKYSPIVSSRATECLSKFEGGDA